MKEKYVSPALFFESFALSQTIARNCGDNHQGTLGESTHYNENTCTWSFGDDMNIFWSHCDMSMEEWGTQDDEGNWEIDIEGLCYNNPDGGQTIFAST